MSEYAYVRLGPNRYRERFGLSFEDLRPGMRIRHRPGVDVSQQDNHEEAVDLLNNAQAKGSRVHCHVFHDEDDARLQAFHRVLAHEFPGLLAAPLAQVA